MIARRLGFPPISKGNEVVSPDGPRCRTFLAVIEIAARTRENDIRRQFPDTVASYALHELIRVFERLVVFQERFILVPLKGSLISASDVFVHDALPDPRIARSNVNASPAAPHHARGRRRVHAVLDRVTYVPGCSSDQQSGLRPRSRRC